MIKKTSRTVLYIIKQEKKVSICCSFVILSTMVPGIFLNLWEHLLAAFLKK
jgi:hypothetical protein